VATRAGGPRVILFGHLGDGNVHVNVLGADREDTRVDDAVLELTLACGGTISAEHGIGVAKAAWLERARGRAEVSAMRAIKQALDPEGLLNPGAVLPR
jgi:FAD/FMN-containing dehydrogenase